MKIYSKCFALVCLVLFYFIAVPQLFSAASTELVALAILLTFLFLPAVYYLVASIAGSIKSKINDEDWE